MSFTLSILSANEILKEPFTVFKLNMHLNSQSKNKYTYSKQYNWKTGGRWLTSELHMGDGNDFKLKVSY